MACYSHKSAHRTPNGFDQKSALNWLGGGAGSDCGLTAAYAAGMRNSIHYLAALCIVISIRPTLGGIGNIYHSPAELYSRFEAAMAGVNCPRAQVQDISQGKLRAFSVGCKAC